MVGLGLNATDTIIRLPHYPSHDSKVEILSADVCPGGQVASAMAACSRWGLRARYIGKIGDDPAGELQREQLAREGVEAHWLVAKDCPSQVAFILVDAPTGERTILWGRDARLEIRAEEIERTWVTSAHALLVDGRDTAAAGQAARWARESCIPVVADLDHAYAGLQVLLECVDFLVAAQEFPAKLTGEGNLLKSLPRIHKEFKYHLTGATLGRLGALAWDGEQFFLSPAFCVQAVDTTGAGDIFHGAFMYGLVRGWPFQEILEFSNAAAAINCTAVGARGRIGTLGEIEEMMRTGRRWEAAFSEAELADAAGEAGGGAK